MQGDGQQTPVPGQPDGQWQYKPEQTVIPSAPDSSEYIPGDAGLAPSQHANAVAWTASEYVAHHKTLSWYGAFAGGASLFTIVLYVVTRDWLSAAAIVIMAIILLIAAGRKPSTLSYGLDARGLTIGAKFYRYSEFRTFSIVKEDAVSSLSFLSLKRFMPPLSVYYDPADEERILDVLNQHLPVAPASNDIIDRLVRRLHF